MSRFLDARYASLEAYVPGEQPQGRRYIKLNTNESPFAPAPGAAACLCEEAAGAQRLYPDPQGMGLRKKLAEAFRLKPENILLGNGSDDILHFAFMAYGGAGVAFADISYGFYKVFAALRGIEPLLLPLCEDLRMDAAAYHGLHKTICIANPNAPTGEALSLTQIEGILATNPDNVVLLDEAYVDFGAQSALPLLSRYENLLIVRTFSKSRSLAGARLGFAMAHPAVIEDLEKMRCSTNPYNVSRLSLAMGEASIEDMAYFEACRKKIMETRAYTAQRLKEMGFGMTNSLANFLFIRHPDMGGREIYEGLREKGVLVRHFDTPRLRDYNRVSVGAREEMEVFLSRLEEIIAERTGKGNA